MSAVALFSEIRTLLGLREIRALLRSRRARLAFVAIAVLYMIISVFVGLMIQPGPADAPLHVVVNPVAHTSDWWNYPQATVIGPGFVLFLPFLPTETMILVSIGVGMAVAASGVLLLATVRARRDTSSRFGVASGVAPAVAGLATMGACCCTSCTATLSVGVIASVSGSDLYTLLQNNWYLDLFQLVVVGVSLLALERGLRTANQACVPAGPLTARVAAGTAFRVALLIAAMTWSLAMFVEWGEVDPWTAPAGLWYHWIFEHQVLSLTALFVALFPREAMTAIRRFKTTPGGWALRIALITAGITWGTWVPANLVALDLGGFVNELFGQLGLPASWGASIPDAFGAALLFHWAFQHLLLSGFAIVLGLRPELAMRPLGWTSGTASAVRAESAADPSA